MASCIPHLRPIGNQQICLRCGTRYDVPPDIPIRAAKCQRLDLTATPTQRAKCGGCSKRQEQLNRVVPGVGAAVAMIADPIAEAIGYKEKSLRLEVTHGLGDCVQFTTVLKHLRAIHPEWHVDVATNRERQEIMRLAGARYTFDPGQTRGEHVYSRFMPMTEPEVGYQHHPGTKAERCLRDIFGIEPVPELCRYHVGFTSEQSAWAEKYLAKLAEDHGPHNGVVLLHYQGRSCSKAKTLDEGVMRDVCVRIRNAGCLPVVLDWDKRTRLTKPGNNGEPWAIAERFAELGPEKFNPCYLAALADQVRLCIGIDSGPGHVFGSETLSTPTLIVWKGHHPYHYYEPAEHVTHILDRGDWNNFHRDQDIRGLGYFEHAYHWYRCTEHLRYELPDLVEKALAGQIEEIRSVREPAVYGQFNAAKYFDKLSDKPDAFINCGVGPYPHSEARQFAKRYRGAPIVGVEPNRELYELRSRDYPGELHNVAVSDSAGELTLYPGTKDGGMSSVLPAADGHPIDYGEPYQVEAVTIDQIAPQCERGFLWLDIEGYEAHALRGATETLKRCQWVLVEVSNTRRRVGEATLDDIEAILNPHGFRTVMMFNAPGSHDRLYAKTAEEIRPPATNIVPEQSTEWDNRRVAYLVAGCESSGTRMLTQSVITTGVWGDGGHDQRFDSADITALPDRIVVRRSVPYGAGRQNHYPDLSFLRTILEDAGYEVIPLVIVRDRDANAKSMKQRGHVTSRQLAYERYDKANAQIAEQLPDAIQIQYSRFVQDATYRREVFSQAGLPAPTLTYRDADQKYKKG